MGQSSSEVALQAPSRVVAVLVTRNGEEWVGAALRTLRQQSYAGLDVVVVDNASTDGTLGLLEGRVPAEQVLRQPANLGFGRAVGQALRHPLVAQAEMVLLVHDDLVLARDAVELLVAALDADPTLGIVGPKLREWAEEYVLAEVGMTTDHFGRADTLLEPGELDQGQRDGQRDVLFVSTAGMLVRRELLAKLGFDPRFPLFRDDYDLCWRAWLSGSRVSVVTDAVGYHLGAAASGLRTPFDARPEVARYLAERHALAAQLKNHSAVRLLWVLPGVVLLGLVRAFGLGMARRFSEAFAIPACAGVEPDAAGAHAAAPAAGAARPGHPRPRALGAAGPGPGAVAHLRRGPRGLAGGRRHPHAGRRRRGRGACRRGPVRRAAVPPLPARPPRGGGGGAAAAGLPRRADPAAGPGTGGGGPDRRVA